MSNGGCDGQKKVGVMIGDGHCGSTIAMGHNGGSAMAGRMAVQS